jgi:hypothetical protein
MWPWALPGTHLVSLPAACPAAWALAVGMVPSDVSQAGEGPARRGPLLCSSPRCQDLVVTTTASILHHRRDLLLLPLEYPGPSSPDPWPLCQVRLLLLAQVARRLWLLLSSGRLLAAPIVVSLCHPPKMETRPQDTRCPQCPGMTCHLCFHTGAGYLSCAYHSINRGCALSSLLSLVCSFSP